MREWLTVIIVLLIVGVLLDGWRRMRQSKQQSIKMSLSMHKDGEREDGESYGSELPNGGARVVAHRDEEDAKELTRSLQESFEQSKTTLQKPVRIPEQVSLNLDEEVPMLMDSVVDRGRQEPSLGEADLLEDDPEAMAAVKEPDVAEYGSADASIKTTSQTSQTKQSAQSDGAVTEEVLVINVMSVGDARFQGQQLLSVILERGMRFGDMQIFHRHEGADGEGEVLFSMVNMVVPGTFDLNSMEQFETPGVSLFMTLPMSANSMQAFDCMADTAKAIADQLGGELKDENRSVMTGQTLEHCRQRVREFERKQLM